MAYDYLQQSDDTDKDERIQTPNCVLYNCTNMKYKSNTAARSQSDASLVRGSVVTERRTRRLLGYW